MHVCVAPCSRTTVRVCVSMFERFECVHVCKGLSVCVCGLRCFSQLLLALPIS